VPYVYYVKDVYPEAAVNAGILRNESAIARACRDWDRRLCLKSASVVVISEAMKTLLATSRQLPDEQFTVIPDWLDDTKFKPVGSSGSWRQTQNIHDDAFVAMFAGTLGYVSGAEVLVNVATRLQAWPEVEILCIGEGRRKEAMIEHAHALGLQNIRFLPFQPSECVPEMQAAADVMLLTTHPDSSDSSVPSKLISYLAAGRPVICAAKEDAAVARTVRGANAGIIVPPGDADAIAEAILRLKKDRRTADEMGQNARKYFLDHYTEQRAYRQFVELLSKTTVVSIGDPVAV